MTEKPQPLLPEPGSICQRSLLPGLDEELDPLTAKLEQPSLHHPRQHSGQEAFCGTAEIARRGQPPDAPPRHRYDFCRQSRAHHLPTTSALIERLQIHVVHCDTYALLGTPSPTFPSEATFSARFARVRRPEHSPEQMQSLTRPSSFAGSYHRSYLARRYGDQARRKARRRSTGRTRHRLPGRPSASVEGVRYTGMVFRLSSR